MTTLKWYEDIDSNIKRKGYSGHT